VKIQTVAEHLRIADELFDGMRRRGRSDSQQRQRPVGFVAECGGPEDPPCARTNGNASRLALKLHGRAADKLHGQGASEIALLGSPSKHNLDFFKKLLPLRLRKTNGQPGEARQ
jgi:hypothetical protein